MAGKYEIDWQPPNLAPGLSLLINARNQKRENDRADRNAETQAEFARLNLQREASRDYYERMKFDQDAQDRQEKAFASAKLMFQQGDKAGALSLLGRHGIKATPETGPETQTPPTLLTPADVLASQPQAPQEATGASPQQQPLTPLNVMAMGHRDDAHAGVSVPEEPPQMPEVPPPDVMAGRQGPGHAVEDLLPMELEPAKTTAGGPTGAYSFHGQQGQDLGRYEPAGPASSGFGPEYDKLYESLVKGGADPTEARKDVFALYKNAQLETGRQTRSEHAVDARIEESRRIHADIDQQDQWKKFLADEAMKRTMAAGKFKVAAAGAEKPSAADAGEAGAVKTFLGDLKDYRDRVAQAGPEVKATRNVSEILRLANSPNPVDQALAVEQIGKIAHGGNTVTKATQDLVYHHMGGAFERGEAMLRQYTDHGTIAPAQLKYLRDTATALAQHHDENKRSIQEGAEIQFGPNSIYGSPYMQPMVRQHLDALYKEMGIQGDPEATAANPTTESTVRLGRKRGAKVGAPGGAHVDPMRAKAQRALDDPNASPEAKAAARVILGH